MKMVALLALLLARAPQDATAVVNALDAALGALQDATCSVETKELKWYLNVRPEGPARLRIRRDGDAELHSRLYDGTILHATVDFTMRVTREGFSYDIEPVWHELLLSKQPICLRARTSFDDLQGCDPLLLPTFYPIRLFMDDELLFYALAPKRYFGLEKELTILEKRDDGTTVLASRTLVKEPIKALGIPFVVAAPIEKRWYVRNHRIDRLWMRIDLGKSGYAAMMVSDVTARDTDGRPTRVELRLTTLFQGRPQRFEPVERTITYDSINTGLTVTAPSAEDVVYADAALRPIGAYARKKDAGSLAGTVAHRLWIRLMIKSLFQVDLGEPEEDKAIEALEKLRELRPKDAFVAQNLLALYRGSDKAGVLLAQEIPGSSWKTIVAAHGRKGTTEQRVRDLLAAAGVEAASVTPAQWAKVAELFQPDELSDWALKSVAAPGSLHRWLAWGAKEPEKAASHMARALALAPADKTLRLEAVDLCLPAVMQNGAEPLKKLAESLDDPLLKSWRLIRDGKKDEARVILKQVEPLAELSLTHGRQGLAAWIELEDYAAVIRTARVFARVSRERNSFEFGQDSPFRGVVRMAVERKEPHVIAELFHPILESNPWAMRALLEPAGKGFRDSAKAWAEEHATEGERIAQLARVLVAAEFDTSQGLALLEAALAKSETKECMAQLADWTLDEGRATTLYEKTLSAGAPETRVARAIFMAAKAGKGDVARVMIKLLPATATPRALENAAQAALAAGEWDAALRFARSMEDHARRPFVLYGQIAEGRKDYEEAVRWYVRDVKEPADPFEQYTAGVEIQELFVARKRISGSDAKKKLMATLGDEFFLKKLIESKQEPLSAEETATAKKAYEQLTAEALDARDEAEEELLKLGRRVAPTLKPGLDSTDSDVRDRVRRILLKLSEP